MGSTWAIQIKIAKKMFILNTIVAVVGYFIFDPWVPFLLGLFFGNIIALLNFRLLSLTLETSVKMPPQKAQAYVTSRYFVRFLLMGLVLLVSIKADYINMIGTIFGLISLKLIILINRDF